MSGTLVDATGKPKPGVELHLTMMHDWQSGDPFAHLQHAATTDGQGRFIFTNVPPGRLDVVRFVPTGQSSWTHQRQTWVIADPGETNELGNVIYDTPPSPPLAEQIKQKLGL